MSTVYGQLLWNVHPATESKLDYSLPSLHARFLFTIPQSSLSRASGIWNKLHSRTEQLFLSLHRNSSVHFRFFLLSFFLSLFVSFFPLFLPPITDKRNSENVDPFFEERIQISLLSTSRAKLPRESSSSSIINQSPTVIFHVKYFREQSKLVHRR